MESPRKFNDCYFYYYSTCTKGDNCVFRHEPSALGCETMCAAWQQGKCLDKKCRLRHMELRKNRKQIPCYWENQPGGCRKKHCPFMHKNPEARTDGIAPSQPAPVNPGQPSAPVTEPVGEQQLPVPPVPVPGVPQPVPLLWQQQRQVVLDSAILGVLPASSELLGARRVLPPHPPHPHDAPPTAYSLPVDPLVVNFEEESDNESVPSSTPTKNAASDDALALGTKSQELLLLEKIQAEAAAYYNYDDLPPKELPKERKIVRTNLSIKYDKVSLDELAGKKNVENKSLDFKVLSLDEIRAKKRSSNEAIIQTKPITLTLNARKRKLSSQETIISSGNKIIKVVRSNSIVYKKVDHNVPNTSTQSKTENKPNESEENRKRTYSEVSDVLEIQDDELEDDCFKFKKVKLVEQMSKPKLIRNISISSDNKVDNEPKDTVANIYGKDDSDSEVQIVSEVFCSKDPRLVETEIIDLDDSVIIAEPIDIVDLSDDDVDEIEASDVALADLVKNVPDVVASCHAKSSNKKSERDLLDSFDAINEDL